MVCYKIKTIGNRSDYMTILRETEDGYVIRIIRDQDGYNDITTDFISRPLFESCERTGYIKKIDEPEVKLAANT